MTLTYHRLVQRDVSEIVRRYDDAGGDQLGDAFFSELTARLAHIRDSPTRFHRWKGDLRRANLVRFRYHVLFRIAGERVRVLVVRHNRRDPAFGLDRQ